MGVRVTPSPTNRCRVPLAGSDGRSWNCTMERRAPCLFLYSTSRSGSGGTWHAVHDENNTPFSRGGWRFSRVVDSGLKFIRQSRWKGHRLGYAIARGNTLSDPWDACYGDRPQDLWLAVADAHVPQRTTCTTVLNQLLKEQVEIFPLIFSYSLSGYPPRSDCFR